MSYIHIKITEKRFLFYFQDSGILYLRYKFIYELNKIFNYVFKLFYSTILKDRNTHILICIKDLQKTSFLISA